MKVTLKDVTMQFHDVLAVDQLNISIESGSLVSFLGPSGCGKSTTLFMLAGLYKPTLGGIYFEDQQVNDVVPEKREIGMVFQNYALYPHMTVLKNIMFPLKMQKISKNEAEQKAREIAALVHIEKLLDRKPAQLSGGQQQRVAIARALVKDPKLLLLDEPLSNLDARLRLEMREEIKRIQRKTGITTVFVTHDQEEALSISDKVFLMKDGKFQQYSSPKEIYDFPNNQFVAEFLGNPPMNFLEGACMEEGKIFVFETEDILTVDNELSNYVVKDEFITIGFRPEDVYVIKDKEAEGIHGRTMMVDRIGRDHLLHVQVGKENIRALVDSTVKVESGTPIKLGIRDGHMHLFRSNDGVNVLR